jgi:anti-sigma factor RsiW
MTHPPGARIQAYLDGELSPADAATIARHVEVCERCAAVAARLRERGAAFTGAIGTVDAIEPSAWRAREERDVVRRSLPPGLRRAAVILLAVSGAAAAAVGGRELIARRADAADPGAAATPATSAAPAAGIVMPLLGDSADVVIENAGTGARLRVRVGDRADLSVNVEGGAGAPTFSVDERAGRIDVRLDGAATVTVDVPATLRAGVVRAGGRVVARITNGRIEPPAAAAAGIPLGS